MKTPTYYWEKSFSKTDIKNLHPNLLGMPLFDEEILLNAKIFCEMPFQDEFVKLEDLIQTYPFLVGILPFLTLRTFRAKHPVLPLEVLVSILPTLL